MVLKLYTHGNLDLSCITINMEVSYNNMFNYVSAYQSLPSVSGARMHSVSVIPVPTERGRALAFT